MGHEVEIPSCAATTIHYGYKPLLTSLHALSLAYTDGFRQELRKFAKHDCKVVNIHGKVIATYKTVT